MVPVRIIRRSKETDEGLKECCVGVRREECRAVCPACPDLLTLPCNRARREGSDGRLAL